MIFFLSYNWGSCYLIILKFVIETDICYLLIFQKVCMFINEVFILPAIYRNCVCFSAVDGRILLSSKKQVICETPLLKQVYDKLHVAGTSGLTPRELAGQLGLRLLDGRNLLTNICRKGLAVRNLHDKGRSGIYRYSLDALLVLSVVVDIFSFISSLSLPLSYLCVFCNILFLLLIFVLIFVLPANVN